MLSDVSSECCLFLKKNNDFPLSKDVNQIGLYGNGVRHTVKGGTGSGNVDSHHFVNIEEAFLERGIEVISKAWLDEYDKYYLERRKEFIAQNKKEAKEIKMDPAAYCVGCIMHEKEYDFSNLLIKEAISIYVLSRSAGEGKDRKPIKGDFLLTDAEIRDIEFLNKNSKKFILVINSATPIDLSPIKDEVDNILLISLLGSVTSETLVSIIFGERYPSGKLSSTWSKISDYPSNKDFGDVNQTCYVEDIFVGYRYFSSENIKPMYPFGFGLGYTDFKIEFINIALKNKSNFEITIKVTNTGEYLGKEVVQIYLSKPSALEFYNSKIDLCGYQKTKELKPKESEILNINFNIEDFSNFSEDEDAYLLNKGIYLISVGNSSEHIKTIASIELKEKITLTKVKHIDNPKELIIKKYGNVTNYQKQSIHFELDKNNFSRTVDIKYEKYEEKIDELTKKLTDNELVLLSMGNIRGGLLGLIGDNCTSVMGAAGETCLKISSINKHLVMADGPAGLRLAKECISSKGKLYKISTDPLWSEINNYLPTVFAKLVDNKKNAKRKGDIYFQYTTSLPVASALANSFNDDVITKCGEIVREEMELYNVDIWLAPAMNIIRSPLCGRNFEYYSEDPYLSGRSAAAMIKAVETNSNKKTCIKHFCCNNQETNRTNSNSILSIRALREIYLWGFKYTISKSKPFSVMSSYNLVNGEHSSQSSFLLNDVLRNEFGFTGLIMTDWISTGDMNYKASVNPGIYASKEIKAGINLVMPGNKKDIKDIKKALTNGNLSREELEKNCSIVIKRILSYNNKS